MSDPSAGVLALVLTPDGSAAGSAGGGDAGHLLVDPLAPQVSALDLGVTRGDGVFEGISSVDGRPQALEAHLRRFAKSALALDLPAPDLDVWRSAILAVCAASAGRHQVSVKAVYTRGIEGTGRPTGWVYGTPATDFTAARRDGVRIVLLDRGYRHDVATTSPWLLQGAKTLSYAVNTASLREARRRGADDVVFVSSDGIVLEGPTSSVLLRRGDRLLTPGTGLAILEGTTQGSIFDLARSAGLGTGFELTTPESLLDADAVWLVSSVRHAVPVVAIDGTRMPVDRELTDRINAFLTGIAE